MHDIAWVPFLAQVALCCWWWGERREARKEVKSWPDQLLGGLVSKRLAALNQRVFDLEGQMRELKRAR